MADEVAALRRKVALSCRILAMMGLVKETTGHVSARVPGTDRITVLGSGVDLAPRA
jgi:ribulose-5-phosphate 4-epimerase/fuculose-1-phosphate aldolase